MNKSYLYLMTTFMLWGSLYVVSQFVLGKIPTFTVAMFRYLIAFIALSFISLKSKKEKIEKSEYKYFFIMGFIGYFISVDCQLLGTKIAGGSMASLINSLNPIIISVMAMITCVHHQLVASAMATKLAHEVDEKNQVGCMLAAGSYYPETCKPEGYWQAICDNREVYMFADVQVRGYYLSYALKWIEKRKTSIPFEKVIKKYL